MRLPRAALLLAALAACGEQSKPAGGDNSRPLSADATVTKAWSWGDPPAGDAGPTGAAFIAAGKGRLAVATRDGCLELLDSLDDLRELWKRDSVAGQSDEPLAQPAAVDGRFCLVVADDQSGRGIECLDPATGAPGEPWTIGGFRIAFGERLIGLITSHRPKSLPYTDGLELMVELHTVDRKRVAERAMAGQYGPRFVRSRPVFVAETNGARGRTRWIVDRDGRELVGEAADRALDASALEAAVGGNPIVDGDMAFAIAGRRVHAYRIAAAP